MAYLQVAWVQVVCSKYNLENKTFRGSVEIHAILVILYPQK